MKTKYLIGVFCVFLSAFIFGGLNVALGVLLGVLGLSAVVDVLATKANRKYQLTAIEGTFRATAEGNDRLEVERDLRCTLENWGNAR